MIRDSLATIKGWGQQLGRHKIDSHIDLLINQLISFNELQLIKQNYDVSQVFFLFFLSPQNKIKDKNKHESTIKEEGKRTNCDCVGVNYN